MVDKEKFAEEEALGYDIHIDAKNFPLTEPMRQHILSKLGKIERFHSHIFKTHIVLDIRKLEHVCTIVSHFNHLQVKVEAVSTDMYASIDRAIQKLQTLFRKWKGRIQDYHKKPMKEVDMVVNVLRRPNNETEEINSEIEAESLREWVSGKVVETKSRPLKILTPEEAVMKMELSGDHFLVYRDEKDRKLKVIYRYTDDHYAIIEVE